MAAKGESLASVIPLRTIHTGAPDALVVLVPGVEALLPEAEAADLVARGFATLPGAEAAPPPAPGVSRDAAAPGPSISTEERT